MLAILTSFGGVILGFFLSQSADWFKSRKTAKRLIKSTRHLHYLEVKKNILLLKTYWEEVHASIQKRYKNNVEISTTLLGHFISDLPFPKLSRDVFLTHLGKITEAFSLEEIYRVWDFYEDMLQLQNLHEGIIYLKEMSLLEEKNLVAGSSVSRLASTLGKDLNFNMASENPISQFKMIIEGIIKYRSADDIFSA